MTDKVQPQSLEVKSGDTLKLPITTVDSVGDPKDLTGATVTFTIARTVRSTPVITKTLGDGITVAAPLTGVIDVVIDASDSDDLHGTYYFECEVIDLAGDKATVAFGFITYQQDLIS